MPVIFTKKNKDAFEALVKEDKEQLIALGYSENEAEAIARRQALDVFNDEDNMRVRPW